MECKNMQKKWLRIKKDKRAEMGVGTMIIFIAMVLVAAVAASVLISTANQVREQAQATGNDAINNVATGFVYQDVVGTVDAGSITQLDINVRLAAGSPDIDMDNVIVTVSDGLAVTDLASGDYDVAAVRDVGATGATFTDNSYVIQGDLIKLTITDVDLSPGTHVTVKIMPAYGQATEITFTTPETYSTAVIILK
jgi:archaeal flagellin FlaB